MKKILAKLSLFLIILSTYGYEQETHVYSVDKVALPQVVAYMLATKHPSTLPFQPFDQFGYVKYINKLGIEATVIFPLLNDLRENLIKKNKRKATIAANLLAKVLPGTRQTFMNSLNIGKIDIPLKGSLTISDRFTWNIRADHPILIKFEKKLAEYDSPLPRSVSFSLYNQRDQALTVQFSEDQKPLSHFGVPYESQTPVQEEELMNKLRGDIFIYASAAVKDPMKVFDICSDNPACGIGADAATMAIENIQENRKIYKQQKEKEERVEKEYKTELLISHEKKLDIIRAEVDDAGPNPMARIQLATIEYEKQLEKERIKKEELEKEKKETEKKRKQIFPDTFNFEKVAFNPIDMDENGNDDNYRESESNLLPWEKNLLQIINVSFQEVPTEKAQKLSQEEHDARRLRSMINVADLDIRHETNNDSRDNDIIRFLSTIKIYVEGDPDGI